MRWYDDQRARRRVITFLHYCYNELVVILLAGNIGFDTICDVMDIEIIEDMRGSISENDIGTLYTDCITLLKNVKIKIIENIINFDAVSNVTSSIFETHVVIINTNYVTLENIGMYVIGNIVDIEAVKNV
jgi:hypothetical protein